MKNKKLLEKYFKLKYSAVKDKVIFDMNTKHFTTDDIEREYGPLTFGRLLRSHRLGENMTQVELSQILGISKQNLNDLENGRCLPSLRRAVGIARKIGQLEELIVQLVLQDQVKRENLKYKVLIETEPRKKKVS